MPLFTIRIEPITLTLDPATAARADRLLDLLEGKPQPQIDAATAALTGAAERLKQSANNLQEAVKGRP